MSVLEHQRGAARRAAVLVGALSTAWCLPAFALDPEIDIAQYAHTAWRIREGFVGGTINAFTQTPDGYLWLGTDTGLYRFDGVKAVPWQPPDGQPLPDTWIRSLLATRDGTLFVGTVTGLASFKGRDRTTYPAVGPSVINALLEDRNGTVWVAIQDLPHGGRLCAIRRGETRCEAQDVELGGWVGALHEDTGGAVWVAAASGLLRYRPEPAQLFAPPSPAGDSFQSLAESEDGDMVIAADPGLLRLANGRFEQFVSNMQLAPPLYRVLRDRDGALWVGTRDRGLARVHAGRIATFSSADGLSGQLVTEIFEDREGTIWVGTLDG